MTEQSHTDWLATAATAHPHRPALIAGNDSYTYAELHESVLAFSSQLMEHAPNLTGCTVGLLLPQWRELVIAIHALRMLGARIVFLHANVTVSGQVAQIHAVQCDYVLIGDSTYPDIAEYLPDRNKTFQIDDIRLVSLKKESHNTNESGTILFTSGTTGEPRAVFHTWEQHRISAEASAQNLGVLDTDNWLCVLPLYHAGGLSIVLRSAIYGTCMTLMEEFNADAVLKTMRKHDITLLSLVPTMLRRMLDANKLFTKRGYPSLRAILLGGAPAEHGLLDEAYERGLPILTTYGMTETASQIVTMPLDAPISKRASAGKPLHGVELRIGDPDAPEQAGEQGLIHVRAPQYGQTEGGHAPRDDWHPTTDIGAVDEDGYLWIHGRADDMIISGGENILPYAIEDAIRKVDGVKDAAVMGMPDEEWGEILTAVVAADVEIPMPILDSHLREALPTHQIPKRWIFVRDLPYTASGKLHRAAVKAMLKRNEDM